MDKVRKHVGETKYTHVLKNGYFWKQVIDLQFDLLSSWFILLRNPGLLKLYFHQLRHHTWLKNERPGRNNLIAPFLSSIVSCKLNAVN